MTCRDSGTWCIPYSKIADPTRKSSSTTSNCAALNFTLKTGDQIVYHVGFLMNVRVPPLSMRNSHARFSAERLNILADAAWRAYKTRKVVLVQRRLAAPLGYEYIAVKL